MTYNSTRKKPRRKPYNTLIFDDPRGPRKFSKLPIIIVAAVLIVATMALFLLYLNKDTGLDDESLEVCFTGNTMRLFWNDAEDVDFVRLYKEVPESENPVFIGEFLDCNAAVPNVSVGEKLTLVFEPVKIMHFGSFEYENKSKKKTVTIYPKELIPPTLNAKVNADSGEINITWKGNDNCVIEIFDVEGPDGTEPLVTGTEKSVAFTVGGEGADFALPKRDKPLRFYARMYIQEEDYRQYSLFGDVCAVNREEFMPDTITVSQENGTDGKYRFTWEEAKPDTYEFMQFDVETGIWETLKTYKADDEFSYEIEWLPSEKNALYKVVSYFENPKNEAEEIRIESERVTVRAMRSPLYCTIWPVINLDVYTNSSSMNVCGSVKAGETLCVLAEENGYFRIRYSEGYGYIDENYVLINLSEYLGDMCHYDITNSYSSWFRTQDYPIPGLTDTVIPGFENICLNADEKEFVVPYLFPCANKLAVAAERAVADNYVFLIHEAFRPHEATRYMYDTTAALLADRVPFLDEERNEIGIPTKEDEETGEISEEYEEFLTQVSELATARAIAEGCDITTDIGITRISQLEHEVTLELQARKILEDQGADPESETGQAMILEMIMGQPTYESAMTNGGSMKLSAFLAQSVSAHNRGIALDMTIESMDTGERLEMQSPIHDLSFRSVGSRNNDNANILKKYMTEAGFAELSSEWWHFQDSATSKELGLGSYLENGVSLEGWKKDNVGWKYQLPSGKYSKDTDLTIDGVMYSFDEDGYCNEYK